jgi:hypothetical protein
MWMDCHTVRTEDGEISKLPYNGTLRETGREEDQKITGEDRLSKKLREVGMN